LIWSGETALDQGLVDAYGNTRSVAMELGAERVVDFTPETDFLQQIADLIGSSAGRGISQYLLGNFSLN
jgi:ClpP class serine protease